MARLHEIYKEKIAPKLKEEFKLENVMEVPNLLKISVNAGIGPFRDNREAVDSFIEDLAKITGQKPSARQARLSEAGFKIRKNDVVGYTVTLRGENMWSFLDKLINIALPRVRDFQGLKDGAFDDNGNYSLGIKEHVIFPEVDPNKVKGIRSLQVTMVMSSKDKDMNKYLLTELGVPFRKANN